MRKYAKNLFLLLLALSLLIGIPAFAQDETTSCGDYTIANGGSVWFEGEVHGPIEFIADNEEGYINAIFENRIQRMVGVLTDDNRACFNAAQFEFIEMLITGQVEDQAAEEDVTYVAFLPDSDGGEYIYDLNPLGLNQEVKYADGRYTLTYTEGGYNEMTEITETQSGNWAIMMIGDVPVLVVKLTGKMEYSRALDLATQAADNDAEAGLALYSGENGP